MAYSYKGSISFGFVYIPITLHTAVRENNISFNLLDKKTMSRVKYKKTCVDCGDRLVEAEDIVKGYEYDDGKFVIFEEDDFERIKSTKDKSITIESFISLDEIDPIYFEKPYYVVPTGAEKAFKLLLEAMTQENKAGLAKAVLGTKETLILIRAKNGRMLLNTLYFESEIQNNPCKDINVDINDDELKLAKALINQMSSTFEPSKYKDEYINKIQKAIEAKINGKEIVSEDNNQQGSIIDLMDALKSSIEELKPKKKSKRKRVIPPEERKDLGANA